jgi:alpha-L-fucosidase 2
LSRVPTDERIRKVEAGGVDPDLEALLFQMGRYFLICSSRPGTQPANLQGIWNDKYNPAWDAKYTSNINLEMNYWPAQTTNLSECMEPLVRMVEELSVQGGLTARDAYGAGGWAFGFNTDLWRTTGPVGGSVSFWSTWQTGGAWLCAQLYDSYRFTGDREYLKRIYPLMKGSAEFFLDTLQEHPKEKYLVTCPSSSPENRHHKIEGKQWALQPSICAAPTMDNQILRDLFGACVEASEELGVDEDFRKKVAATARRLPPTKIGRYGQIQEWLDDWDDPKDTHRHLSHLYGIYPGSEITPQESPDLIEAARVTIRHRGLLSTGWSMAWKVGLFARMLDGEMSHKSIRYMLNYRDGKSQEHKGYKGGVTNNLFCSHPPFQIDGNFGVCAGMAEMLLQSHDGTVHLLPALPKAWKEGLVTGLCARGGFEVDITWNDGRLAQAVVRSKLGKPCVVRYGDHQARFETQGGRSYVIGHSGEPVLGNR